MKTGRLITKLPFIIPLMLALTSCSTIGGMQQPPAAAQKPHAVQTHHVTHHNKPHHIVHHAKKAQVRHPVRETVDTSTAKPVSKPVAKPVPVIKQKIKLPAANIAAVTPAAPVQHIYMTYTPALIIETNSFENANPRSYKTVGHRRDVIRNLDYLDKNSGQYHYIQVVRWDGTNVTESVTNARIAKLEALIGLGMLDDSYLDTSFGPTIIMLGGSAYLTNVRGLDYDLILIDAKRPPEHGKNYTRIQSRDDYLTLYAQLEASLKDNLDTAFSSICTVDEADNTSGPAIYQLPSYIHARETQPETSQLQIMNLQS